MTVILPIIAVLSVTSEWSQRTGLATFTLVPHRGRVLLAKAIAAVLVALAATACRVRRRRARQRGRGSDGRHPRRVGPGPRRRRLLRRSAKRCCCSSGSSSARSSATAPGAIVAYMIYAFVAPGLLAFLAFNQAWFADARPWVDPKFNQDALLRGELTGDGWTHLAVTSLVWLVVPWWSRSSTCFARR